MNARGERRGALQPGSRCQRAPGRESPGARWRGSPAKGVGKPRDQGLFLRDSLGELRGEMFGRRRFYDRNVRRQALGGASRLDQVGPEEYAPFPGCGSGNAPPPQSGAARCRR